MTEQCSRKIGAPLVIPNTMGEAWVWRPGERRGASVSLIPFADLNGLTATAIGAIVRLQRREVVELIAGGVVWYVARHWPSESDHPLVTTNRFDLDAPSPTRFTVRASAKVGA